MVIATTGNFKNFSDDLRLVIKINLFLVKSLFQKYLNYLNFNFFGVLRKFLIRTSYQL